MSSKPIGETYVRVWTRDGKERLVKGKKHEEGYVKAKGYGPIIVGQAEPVDGKVKPGGFLWLKKKEAPIYYAVEGDPVAADVRGALHVDTVDPAALPRSPLFGLSKTVDAMVEGHVLSELIRATRQATMEKNMIILLVVVQALTLAVLWYLLNDMSKVMDAIADAVGAPRV